MAPAELFFSDAWSAQTAVLLCFPLAAMLTTWLCRRVMHQAALQWVRFRSQQRIAPLYNADAKLRIEAPTCSALLNADEIAARLFTPTDYLRWLNPQQALQKMTATHAQYCEETVDALMDSTHPNTWAALPQALKKQCYAHAERYLTPFLDDVLDDLIDEADHLFDFHETIRTQLKRQQFDQTGNYLTCLEQNSEPLFRRHEGWALALAPLLAIGALFWLPELSATLSVAPTPTRISLLLMLVCGGTLLTTLLAPVFNSISGRRLTPCTQLAQGRKDWQGQKTNPTRGVKPLLPEHLRIAAEALSKALTQALLDIPSQIHSLQSAPKRDHLERIVSRRFQQWFIDTLPTFGLRQQLAAGPYLQLLRAEASFQCIQAMDRPFDDPDFIDYCSIRVESALNERLAKLSGQQFSALLTQAQSNYRTGRLLLLCVLVALTALTACLTYW